MQELLPPSPININTIHIPGDDLLHFIRVQQWVQAQLRFNLPLLKGVVVAAPAADLQQLPPQELLAAHGDNSGSTDAAVAAAVSAMIPWRLRQVSAVDVAPHVDPADAVLVLVGGSRVRAGAVMRGRLWELQDYQVRPAAQAGRRGRRGRHDDIGRPGRCSTCRSFVVFLSSGSVLPCKFSVTLCTLQTMLPLPWHAAKPLPFISC